jgi:hypothetical protein
MRIRLAHGLPYVEATLEFRGRRVQAGDVILDTGSAGTIFSADRLLEIGIVPEPSDRLLRIRGVGGTEYAFSKRLDQLAVGDIELVDFTIQVGAMEYGFPADGVVGLDFLLRAGALIDLHQLELRASMEP